MLLILSNFYDENMPSWPKTIAIHGVNLIHKGYNIHWIMPHKTGVFNKIEKSSYNEVDIYLIPFTTLDDKIAKAISMIIYYFRLLIFLLKTMSKNRYDIVEVKDDAIAGVIALIIKSIFKAPITYNHSFPFYQGAKEAYKSGIAGITTLLYEKIKKIILCKIVLKYVDFIFPVSIEMIYNLEKEGIKKEKMLPIPLGIEPSIFQYSMPKMELLRKKFSLEKKYFVFINVGSMSKMRGTSLIIKAFKKVLKTYPNTKMLLVGDGDDLQNLKEIVKDLGIDNNVIFTGKAPYWDVPSYISIADVGLSIIYPRKCYYVSSPCKLFEYMVLKKPVIANIEIPEHQRVIENSNCGLLIEYDTNQLANAMLWMLEHPKDLEKMGKNGYEWVINNRNFKKMAKKLDSIYVDLLQKR